MMGRLLLLWLALLVAAISGEGARDGPQTIALTVPPESLLVPLTVPTSNPNELVKDPKEASVVTVLPWLPQVLGVTVFHIMTY